MSNDLDALLEDALQDFNVSKNENKENQNHFKNNEDFNEMKEIIDEMNDKLYQLRSADEKNLQRNLEKFVAETSETGLNETFINALKDYEETIVNGKEKSESIDNYVKETMKKEKEKQEKQEKNEIDETVAKTLENLAKSSQEPKNIDSTQVERMGEEMMEEMMQKFEEYGEKNDFPVLIDDMMKQLLSKDVLYDPMKMICEKYPEWLADNEEVLTPEDYQKYGHQYQCFQRIVATYEMEPENFERIHELMQDLQEFGQPPVEIVKCLAPELEFTEDGMPVLPNIGPNVMPENFSAKEILENPTNCLIM